MLKIKSTVLKVLCFLLLSAFVVFFAFKDSYGVTFASAETVMASAVLDDLHNDESFIESNYPENTDDYSLQLIQIAESTDGELLVYVYQPSGQEKDLRVTSINISTSAVEEINPDNYKLKFCNSSGVFYKYVVDGLTVNSDATRYYAIPSIFRAFIDEIDTPAGFDNTITEIPYEVEKQYCFSEINGSPYCKVVDFETIEVTDKFVGFVRYSKGFSLSPTSCDSHFVAFNTDKPIDRLLEAKVYYTYQSASRSQGLGLNGEWHFGESLADKVELSYDQEGESVPNGWFNTGAHYSWKRIETVDDFLNENNVTQNLYSGAVINVNVANSITEDGMNALQGKTWVLRFTETSYSFTGGQYSTTEFTTLVGDVTILRLKFVTNGVTYNLGVIDNKQTGSRNPINNEELQVNFDPLIDMLKLILFVILIIMFFIVLGVICPPIVKAIKIVFKSVAWVISLPFKLLGSIFKRK